jgi:hypothetical protein
LSKTSIRVINEIDNSIFCEVRFIFPSFYNRKFVREGNYEKNDDENCQILSKSIFKDGTIGVYKFDEDTDIKIQDLLGNKLHGWAVNGTKLTSEPTNPGIFRECESQSTL